MHLYNFLHNLSIYQHNYCCSGVEELLKHFPDQVNIKNSTHKTPLYLATLNGHTDIVNFLLSQKVSYIIFTNP